MKELKRCFSFTRRFLWLGQSQKRWLNLTTFSTSNDYVNFEWNLYPEEDTLTSEKLTRIGKVYNSHTTDLHRTYTGKGLRKFWISTFLWETINKSRWEILKLPHLFVFWIIIFLNMKNTELPANNIFKSLHFQNNVLFVCLYSNWKNNYGGCFLERKVICG